MTFQVIGAAAKDPNFQNRCAGSIISLAAAILAAPLAGGSIKNNALVDLTTTACKNLATNYCKGTNLFTDKAAASLMLLNSDVAANPTSAVQTVEDAVAYQTKEIWLTLVAIG
jgi:hypothetical protein